MPASKVRASGARAGKASSSGASTGKTPSKRSGKRGSVKPLQEILDELPEDLARQVFAHASWTERRSDSFLRLAFLGDSVLGLAVTTHLYPRLEVEKFGA